MNRTYLIFGILALLPILGISLAITGSLYPSNDVLAVAYQSDGKLIIAGKFSPNFIERRLSDQSIDHTFSSTWTTEGFNREVSSLAVLEDDSIVVGGAFTSFNSTLVGSIARLNRDGQIDLGFARNQGTGFDGTVSNVYIKNEPNAGQSIFVVGDFTNYNGFEVNGFAKLNSDGTLVQTFQGPNCDDSVNALSIVHFTNESESMLIGGSFQNCNSAESLYLNLLSIQ